MKHLVLFLTMLLVLAGLCACTAKPAVSVPTDSPAAGSTAEAPSDEPGDTALPAETETLAITEALALEGVRPAAEAAANALGLTLDIDAAECIIANGGEYASVSIPVNGGGTLSFNPVLPAEDGAKLASGSASLTPPEDAELSSAAAGWLETFGAEQITVTPDDIAAAGCTATEGDEYLEAAYGCFAAKLAEKYMGAEAENPARCTAADVVSFDADDHGTHTIKLAVIPADPYGFIYYCDGLCTLCTEGEYAGRLIAVSQCELTQNEDGSFSAPAFAWLGV
ncbi:MAG: hypothetical protein II536_04865 [Clostridia bacterium]|nr:hypothetical protein [Clostridia bacterium]